MPGLVFAKVDTDRPCKQLLYSKENLQDQENEPWEITLKY